MAKEKQHDTLKMEGDDEFKLLDEIFQEGVQQPAQSSMKSKNKVTQKRYAESRLTENPTAKEDESSNLPNAPSHDTTLRQHSSSGDPNSGAHDKKEDVGTDYPSSSTDTESMLSSSPAPQTKRSKRASAGSLRKDLTDEIADFLEDAPRRTRAPSVQAFNFDDDYGRVRVTRNTKKNLQLLSENKPLSPPPDMNLRRLTYKQFSDVRDRKVFDNVMGPKQNPNGNDEDSDGDDLFLPSFLPSEDNGSTIDNLDSTGNREPRRSGPMRGSKLRAMETIQDIVAKDMAAKASKTRGFKTAESNIHRASSRSVSTQDRRHRSSLSDKSWRRMREGTNHLGSDEGTAPLGGPHSKTLQRGNVLSSAYPTAMSAVEAMGTTNHGNDLPNNKVDSNLASKDAAKENRKFASKENVPRQSERVGTVGISSTTANQARQFGLVGRAIGEVQGRTPQPKAHKRRSMSPHDRPQKKIRLPPTV